MNEKCLTGRIFYREDSSSKYGVQITSRTEYGQGWGMDLNNITPTDLRIIADFLEERLKNQNNNL